MRVIRLNYLKFPPTAGEQETLARHGITTVPFEPAAEEVSPDEIQGLLAEGDIDGVIIVSAKLQAGAIEVLGRSSCRAVTPSTPHRRSPPHPTTAIHRGAPPTTAPLGCRALPVSLRRPGSWRGWGPAATRSTTRR